MSVLAIAVCIGIATFLIVSVVASRAKSQERDHAARMWELRFPTFDEYGPERDTFRSESFADFKEMLLVDEASDYNYDSVRIYHLRRLDGPIWQMKEEYESWRRSLADAENHEREGFKNTLTLTKENVDKLRAGAEWVTIESESMGPRLEVAYQRFISQYRDTFWIKNRVDLAMDGLRRRDALAKRQRESGTDEAKSGSTWRRIR